MSHPLHGAYSYTGHEYWSITTCPQLSLCGHTQVPDHGLGSTGTCPRCGAYSGVGPEHQSISACYLPVSVGHTQVSAHGIGVLIPTSCPLHEGCSGAGPEYWDAHTCNLFPPWGIRGYWPSSIGICALPPPQGRLRTCNPPPKVGHTQGLASSPGAFVPGSSPCFPLPLTPLSPSFFPPIALPDPSLLSSSLG